MRDRLDMTAMYAMHDALRGSRSTWRSEEDRTLPLSQMATPLPETTRAACTAHWQ